MRRFASLDDADVSMPSVCELVAQLSPPRRRRRRADHHRTLPPERGDVVRDVGGAAEAVVFVIELHHRHRRFRRNAIDPADHEMIEHQVADDQHRVAPREGCERLVQIRGGGAAWPASGAVVARWRRSAA